MKKILFAIVITASISSVFAQNNPRPTRSRFWNNKASTFTVKPGDVLVYDVENSGDKYQFIVTVKKFGETINFGFTMPEKGTKANVNIQAAAVKTAVAYNNYFNNKDKDLSTESSVWLSKKNFRDLATGEKQTTMDVGSGAETFVREQTSTQKLKYKGVEKIVTVYKVANANATDRRELSVLTELNNPLIVSMNLGWTITLKEVR